MNRLALAAAFALAASAAGAAPDIALPTDNDALFRDAPEAFYQHVERTFEGVKSTPWQGGQFGFSRDPARSASTLLFRKFHEGIDIRPVRRAPDGEPLDDVRSLSAGTVVYANPLPGASNYGRYVVVRHRWDGCDYFSLYAHLAEVAAAPGQPVAKGERLGRMGYSGSGIDKPRAHLHLEIALMLNLGFETWYEQFFRSEQNKNGIYNGMNLAGLDPAKLFVALREHPDTTLPDFIRREKTAFRVAVPSLPPLARRYPWLIEGTEPASPGSWEISFNAHGLPLRIAPLATAVAKPAATYAAPSPHPIAWTTRRLLSGTPSRPVLAPQGERLIALLLTPEP